MGEFDDRTRRGDGEIDPDWDGTMKERAKEPKPPPRDPGIWLEGRSVELDCTTGMGDNHLWRDLKILMADTGQLLERWRQCDKCKRVECL